jgi:DNA (cytosine-5)-methyltransferase 1
MLFIDLFSGAGGLSEGFINAGFEPVAHVEIDNHACKTIETRLFYHYLRSNDRLDEYNDYLLGRITREELSSRCQGQDLSESVINKGIGENNNKDIFGLIDKLLNGRFVDVVIGGPPCQAYSLVGRSRDKNGMKDDPRNFLYKEYAKFLKKYTPKVFVFENVLGLITAEGGVYFKNMQAYFKRLGYELEYQIQKSENFGVLQKRRRIILIGWQKGLNFSYPIFPKEEFGFKISDILSDLIDIEPGHKEEVSFYARESTEYLERFDIRNGVDFVTQHIARPHNNRDLEIYQIAIKKWIESNERLKYPDLPKRLKTHKNEKSFVDRYKVVDVNGLSHTMVAHIAKDGHHYIYPDLNQVRSLSIREAARIQSFPDNYYFEGGRSAAFRQIGNAVPPLMAKAIAEKIRPQLEHL